MPDELDLLSGHSVYQYTFLDELGFIRSPSEYLATLNSEPPKAEEIRRVVDRVAKQFLAAGWEGDGNIGVIWIPPFVDVGVEDTWGTYVWHVKQKNNGVSFLSSPCPLNFERLRLQNTPAQREQRGTPESIVHLDADNLSAAVKGVLEHLEGSLNVLSTLGNDAPTRDIQFDLLAHNQGVLIRTLHKFLDDCYLRFLIEAMNGNSARLKIRKSRVHLSPPREADDELEEERGSWITVQGVIADMWKSYKMESYRVKLEMLFKSVDFTMDKALCLQIAKHVLIRNSVQHNEGCVDHALLKQLGMDALILKSGKGDVEVKGNAPIPFFLEEIHELGNALIRLAQDFDAHVFNHVPLRSYPAVVGLDKKI